MGQKLFDRLRHEHNQIKDILVKMSETTNSAQIIRDNLLLKLRQILIPHIKAEENVLYSALKSNSQSHQITLEAMEEHHVVSMVFQELENTPSTQDTYRAKCKVLLELLEHHIEEEEAELFDSAEEVLGKEGLEKLFDMFTAKQEFYLKSINMRQDEESA